jgi:Phage tail tube protein, GTA-gp10
MPNAHRGEIEAILNGEPHRLCLTLGALADLEHAFGEDNMLALAKRFEGGSLSARDCIRIIGAGMRGGGTNLSDAAVAQLQAEGGIAGFVDIVARLLTITFAAPQSTAPAPNRTPSDHPSGVTEPRPFPGAT